MCSYDIYCIKRFVFTLLIVAMSNLGWSGDFQAKISSSDSHISAVSLSVALVGDLNVEEAKALSEQANVTIAFVFGTAFIGYIKTHNKETGKDEFHDGYVVGNSSTFSLPIGSTIQVSSIGFCSRNRICGLSLFDGTQCWRVDIYWSICSRRLLSF